ncbi:MAG: SIR2 family protein [Candidatus Aenigmarchaeota archaeon]|nr:SIR2 family protein [Candidatus Aenigmarchaeota archaeon]
MNLRTGSKRTLVILGAGATRGALSGVGSPRVVPPLNRDFFKILNKFIVTTEGVKFKKAYKRLFDFIDREIGPKGIPRPTMEEVFNVLFISKDLPEIFHKGRGRRRTAGFRKEVRDFLSLLIRVFHFLQARSKNRDGIRHHEMITKALEPSDTILTLNYDTIMDNTLVQRGWNPRTGYGFQAQVKFETGIRPDGFSQTLRDVRLLKPHGSFNWYAKGKFNELESVLENRPVSKIVISRLPKLYEDNQQKLVRFFIPPLYTKFFKNKFWSKVWTLSYLAIRNAERIVIIGCSLIATDYHLRAIIAKAMFDKGKRYEEILIVDPDKRDKGTHKSVQKSLKSFFRGRSDGGCKTYDSFTQFCRKAF